MINSISQSFVQIHTKKKAGTGIIYYPDQDADKVYIFTARHCLEDAKKQDIWLKKISNSSGEFEEYPFKNDTDHVILIDDAKERDLAILVLPKDNLYGITKSIAPVLLLDESFDFKNTISVGYPSLNNNQLLQLDGEFRSFLETPLYRFRVKSNPSENLDTLTTESKAAVDGMSGGGLFYKHQDNLYLYGILTDFKKQYKDFECIRLNQLNYLLKQADLPLLPFTYASNINLNENWFSSHVQKTNKDLGDRYTKELPSFELPASQLFNGLGGGTYLKELIREKYHTFLRILTDNQSSLHQDFLETTQNEIKTYYSFFLQHFQETNWEITSLTEECIPIEKLNSFKENLIEAGKLIREKVREEIKRREKKKENEYLNYPYSNESYYLRIIQEALYEFRSFFESPLFRLSYNPCLLIKGKAGNGKSHLLGDIACKRLEKGIPSILVLGNQLLNRTPPWEQIIKNLGLATTKDNLLTILNKIGEHKGERILFMVDALNEGEGKNNFWVNHLSGFIEDFAPYPYVGLVFSIRSTYYESVIPEILRNDEKIIQYKHDGFAGRELEAIKHFSKYFGLEQPQIPLISPEFSNPQFLLLLCRTLKSMGETKIPDGLNGITSIYNGYTQSVNQRLITSGNYQHPNKFNIVQDSLEFFLKELQQDGALNCTYEDGIDIFSRYTKSENNIQLFYDLIKENILTEERGLINIDNELQESNLVRFTFERFGNHIEVASILKNCKNPSQLFRKNGFYNQLYKQNRNLDEGILEALAVQLPEKFNKELFEVIPKNLEKNQFRKNQLNSNVAFAFMESLLWRKKESIDLNRFQDYLNKGVLRSRNWSFFYNVILTIAPLPNHPLNADSLHKNLIKISMPQRDSWWTELIHDLFAVAESPISRLIEWILDYKDYDKLNRESIRLTAITLTWFLGSPNQALRDTSTVALVKILENHLDILITLLHSFEKIDDAYISERLYAIAFGCITRSEDTKEQGNLAQYTYNKIFKKGNPPVNILLRDYARNTIEYALSRNIKLKNFDASKTQPPYRSSLPLNLPSKEEMSIFDVANDSPEYKSDPQGYDAQNAISHSVLDWDFNRYTIRSALDNFYKVSFTEEAFYKSFKRSLTRKQKEELKIYQKTLEQELNIKNKQRQYSDEFKDKDDTLKQMLYETKKIALKHLKGSLSKKTIKNLNDRILPYLYSLANVKSNSFKLLDHQPYARWIMKRIFELGWSKDLYTSFERSPIFKNRGHYKYGGKIERIGKKYQWIAFYEILTRIADNFPLKPEWNETKLEKFNGPWDSLFSARNIDPTLTFYFPENYIADNDSEVLIREDYNSWHISNWVKSTHDLPDPKSFLTSTKDGHSWISLKTSQSWKEPTPLGSGNYDFEYKKIFYIMESYFIKQKDLTPFVELFSNQMFSGNDLPKPTDHHEMLLKEFYWSPHYKNWQKRAKKDDYHLWRYFYKSPFRGIIPYEIYSAGGGSYKLQNGVSFHVPSKYLFDGMELRYGKSEGEYLNKKGEVIVKSSLKASPYQIQIRKDELLAFLKKKRLAICWTLIGEKLQQIHSPRSYDRINIRGVYYLSPSGDIQGDFNTYNFD